MSTTTTNSTMANTAAAAAHQAGTRHQGKGLMTQGNCKTEAAAQQQQASSNSKLASGRYSLAPLRARPRRPPAACACGGAECG